MSTTSSIPFPPTSTFITRHAPPTPSEMEAKRAEANAARDRLIQAYGDVFCFNEANRTESQSLVWEDMIRAGFIRRPTAVHTESAGIDPYGTAQNEGARRFMLDRMEAVHQAELLARGGDHKTARAGKGKFKA